MGTIHDRFDVQPVINACGTVTRLGGALMPPEVLEAMREAAAESVSMEQLQARASDVIVRHTKAEAGIVTAGSAAALTMGTAAILARSDLARMEQLPHLKREPTCLLVARDQRSGYDHAVRAAGAKLVEVGFNEVVSGAGVRRTEKWEYAAAIDETIAGILYVQTGTSRPPLAEVVEVARDHNLPVLVDAAGELPPRENLSRFVEAGADLVAFSGGKAIRGPQATGILCGCRELIGSAFLQMLDMDDHFSLWSPPPSLVDKTQMSGLPRHGIGRGMKVAKEDLIGLLVALELFASGVYDHELPLQRSWLDRIVVSLADAPVECRIDESQQAPPCLTITLLTPSAAQDAHIICQRLRQGSPPVFVGHSLLDQGGLVVHPLCLNESHVEVLCRRLAEEIGDGRLPS